MNTIAYIQTHFCIISNVLVLQRGTFWINIFLDNILYCVKQISANTKLPWRIFFSEINKTTALRVRAFREQSGWFRHFNTRHAIYPQFSSVASHQWLEIKASIVTEPLRES